MTRQCSPTSFSPVALGMMIASFCMPVWSVDCTSLGLVKTTADVLQIQEAGQDPQVAVTYRSPADNSWFIPLKGQAVGASPHRQTCSFEQINLWQLPANDTALQVNPDTGTLTFLDLTQATQVIDSRKPPTVSTATVLDSMGLNYQLLSSYAGSKNSSRLTLGASGEFYAYRDGWYYNTNFAWTQGGRVARYESYALKESPQTGVYLRLGDAVSSPTPQGESVQFAGLSWGTDRSLRPSDFSPVLPTLRNGNALAGPLEVFINDNLQFQQNVQNGVVDLRNLPAQQGFNSYRVRTLDSQGNPITVQREIYLPATLLPPGITAWRIDAGWQRENFFTHNASYGAPVVVGTYSTGLTHDLTVGGQGLVSRRASSFALEAGRRLTDLWAAHLGLLWARNTGARDSTSSLFSDTLPQGTGIQQGGALQVRLDGGGRFWRLLMDATQAPHGLPSLGSRAPLRSKRLIQAQWSGVRDWTFGATHVQSQREQNATEQISSLSATTRVSDKGASLSLALTHTRFKGVGQRNVLLALVLPLTNERDTRSSSVYLSQNHIDKNQLSRAQYSSNDSKDSGAPNWGLGATRDSQQTFSALDGTWSTSTRIFDLQASARVGRTDRSGLITLRSNILWTGGQLLTSRPLNGAFAMVSTGAPDVEVSYENRPAGLTNADGVLLVPGLVAQQINRLSVNPATWPINWTASQLDRQVIPPRGGGVLVPFKINVLSWASQPMVKPLLTHNKPYPPGTVAVATGFAPDGIEPPNEAVIDTRGELWTGELMSSIGGRGTFSITLDKKRCHFTLPASDTNTAAATQAIALAPDRCEDTP
jgi:outer membrane usher protein